MQHASSSLCLKRAARGAGDSVSLFKSDRRIRDIFAGQHSGLLSPASPHCGDTADPESAGARDVYPD